MTIYKAALPPDDMPSMQNCLEKALRNEELAAILVANEPNRFFDHKIVALFYAALHYLRALAAKRSIYIGETHYDIENSCNPDRNGPRMPINRDAWFHYKNLLKYSKEARYNSTIEQELKEFEFCRNELITFKRYIKAQGVPLPG